MTTASDVIEEVGRLLLSDQREELNKLAADVSSSAGSLSFSYDLGGIRSGALVDIDMETYRVWSVDSISKTATVEPGMNGSTTAAHTSGTLVYVNPRLSRASIYKALNDEIRSLSSPVNGLFQIKTFEFGYRGAQIDYDFVTPTDVIDVWEIRLSVPGPEMDWKPLRNCIYKPTADSTMFPSGSAIHVPNGLPGRQVQVIYKAPFTTVSSTSDDIASVTGMPVEMHDILALGILLRLGPVREIKRSFTEAEGDARRAEEVPAMAVSNSFNAIRQLRATRIAEEANRLATTYPTRHT